MKAAIKVMKAMKAMVAEMNAMEAMKANAAAMTSMRAATLSGKAPLPRDEWTTTLNTAECCSDLGTTGSRRPSEGTLRSWTCHGDEQLQRMLDDLEALGEAELSVGYQFCVTAAIVGALPPPGSVPNAQAPFDFARTSCGDDSSSDWSAAPPCSIRGVFDVPASTPS